MELFEAWGEIVPKVRSKFSNQFVPYFECVPKVSSKCSKGLIELLWKLNEIVPKVELSCSNEIVRNVKSKCSGG